MEENGYYYLVFLAPLVVILVFGAILIKVAQSTGRYAKKVTAVTQLVGVGLPTTAEVLEIQDTGLRKHQIYFLVRLRLAVKKTQDFDDFEAETLTAISPVQAPAFAAGKEIRVKVDASNHSLVVIDQPTR
jgi:hypothetical protein